MNQQHQRATDGMSTYAGDQPTAGESSLRDGERVVNLKPVAAMPKEVKEIFEAYELDLGTTDELEDFLRAWEELPEEARPIF